MGFGVLSACATHDQESRQPTAPKTPSVPAWSFETEWAKAAAVSPPGSAGQAWEHGNNPAVEQAYGSVLDDCATQRLSSDPGTQPGQRLVLAIAHDGSVREVWSEIDSPLLACARASLSRARFAPPPVDGYRLGLLLDLGDPSSPSDFPRLPRPKPGPISSDEARRLALMDTGSEEGQAYVQHLTSAFLDHLRINVTKCLSIPLLESERSLRGYRLLIEIGSDGGTRRILVEPDPEASAPGPFQSPRATCLRDGMSHAQLAVPPWDGFWMYLGLDHPATEVPLDRENVER